MFTQCFSLQLFLRQPTKALHCHSSLKHIFKTRKLRHTDFTICTGSQRTSVTVQKNSRPPDLSSHIQSYLSHVMIFKNTNFNLILPLLNPRYFSLQRVVRYSGECQTDWSCTFTVTSARTPRSQLRYNFHTARYGNSPCLHFELGSCRLLDGLQFVQWLILQISVRQLHHSGSSAHGL